MRHELQGRVRAFPEFCKLFSAVWRGNEIDERERERVEDTDQHEPQRPGSKKEAAHAARV